MPKLYAEVIKKESEGLGDTVSLERESLGFTHCEVGGSIANKKGFSWARQQRTGRWERRLKVSSQRPNKYVETIGSGSPKETLPTG